MKRRLLKKGNLIFNQKKTQLLNDFYYRLCKTTHLNKYIYK